MLINTRGYPVAMPADLDHILNDDAFKANNFHSQSYSTKNGNMGLVLTVNEGSMLKQITKLELD